MHPLDIKCHIAAALTIETAKLVPLYRTEFSVLGSTKPALDFGFGLRSAKSCNYIQSRHAESVGIEFSSFKSLNRIW